MYEKTKTRKRSSQNSEYVSKIKRRRSSCLNNPFTFRGIDQSQNNKYADYEDDDVFVNAQTQDNWKFAKRVERPVYYDLNQLVKPVQIKTIETKSAKILTRKMSQNERPKSQQLSGKFHSLQRKCSGHSISKENLNNGTSQSKSSAVYYDIAPPLPQLDTLSVSSDSGISEDSNTLSSKKDSNSKATITQSCPDIKTQSGSSKGNHWGENKVKFL